MSARWGRLCKYLMSNRMNFLEILPSPHREAEHLNFCFRMRSGSCGYAAQQRPLPARLFDPILPDAWYILHVFQSKYYEWISGYWHYSHQIGDKKKKKTQKTISKIILVHSPGMLYNKSIINEDIRSDLHFPPPHWFSSVPPPLSYLSLRFFSLLSLTDSLLSSPSSSPQEGEADGGSGKIRWAEDEDGDGGDGKQLGKGGHTCQGGEWLMDYEGGEKRSKKEGMIKWWGGDDGR